MADQKGPLQLPPPPTPLEELEKKTELEVRRDEALIKVYEAKKAALQVSVQDANANRELVGQIASALSQVVRDLRLMGLVALAALIVVAIVCVAVFATNAWLAAGAIALLAYFAGLIIDPLVAEVTDEAKVKAAHQRTLEAIQEVRKTLPQRPDPDGKTGPEGE